MNYLSMMTGDAFNYGTIFCNVDHAVYQQLHYHAAVDRWRSPLWNDSPKTAEEGRKKIAAITRYVAVALGLLQSTAYYFYLRNTKTNGVNFLLKDPATGAVSQAVGRYFRPLSLSLY